MKKLVILTFIIITIFTIVGCNTNDNAVTETPIINTASNNTETELESTESPMAIWVKIYNSMVDYEEVDYEVTALGVDYIVCNSGSKTGIIIQMEDLVYKDEWTNYKKVVYLSYLGKEEFIASYFLKNKFRLMKEYHWITSGTVATSVMDNDPDWQHRLSPRLDVNKGNDE